MKEIVTDVAIVGFGGSGAVAALEAYDAGASVVVLEKTEEGGGSTRESSGSLRLVNDVDTATEHFHALTFGATPRPILRVFAEGLTELSDWIRSRGGIPDAKPVIPGAVTFPYPAPTTAFAGLPGAEGVGGRLRVRAEDEEGGGASLWNVLYANIETRDIDIHYSTPGKRLVKNENNEIVGVIAESPEGEIFVRTRKGVVLTCGGFNYNREMQKQFLGVELPALSPPWRNTGDGIKMAQDVGADLWHMNATVVGFGYKVEGYDAAFYAKLSTLSFFVVDQRGQRYVNETALESHSGLLATHVIEPIEGRYLRIPSYLIFDEDTRTAGPIVTKNKHSYNQRFPWSWDNSDEVEKGWITVDDTIEGLAGKLGLPPETLAQTTARYNRVCEEGGDAFGRDQALMKQLNRPPFYGIPLWPALINTQGGPRRDEHARVIGAFGEPIRRLYSAGELGSIWGSLYPGAGNVCECIIFGRIAGTNVAKEESLKF